MKLSFAIFICCLTILNLSSAASVTIECEFLGFGGDYGCFVQNKEVFTDDRDNIEKIKGEHEEGKTDDDVQFVFIRYAPKLKFLPKNLNNYFKNLIRINILSSNLAEITREDLKVFPKLKYLYLESNQIEVIREDTFEFNKELELIDLSRNENSHIDKHAFSQLPKLEYLWLNGNYCALDWDSSKEKVQKLIEKIEQDSCQSHKFETTT